MGWFKGFFDWLWCLLKAFFNEVMNILAIIYNFTIGMLIMLLPDTPFQFTQIEWGNFGRMIGYLLPVSQILTHFTLIIAAVGIYYLIRHALRMVKMLK